jgi:hypothetical protein
MKNVTRIFAIVLITITTSCKAQQMIQTTTDVYKLKANEQQFVNKPLKYLLSEIKPGIKTAWGNNEEGHQFFSFRFTTLEQQKKNDGSLTDRVSLYVYVKELIDWNFDNRPKGSEYSWTKDDVEKYGNLTVIRIKVIEKK